MLVHNFERKATSIEVGKNIKFLLEEKELNELQKDILNYCDLNQINILTTENQRLLKEYYLLLSTKQSQGESLKKFQDDFLFTYDKWNLIVNKNEEFQKFLQSDFYIYYNNFIEGVFNKTIIDQMNQILFFLDTLKNIYKNNINNDGKPAFDPIKINQFDNILKKKIEKIKEERDQKIQRINIRAKGTPVPGSHTILIK